MRVPYPRITVEPPNEWSIVARGWPYVTPMLVLMALGVWKFCELVWGLA